MTEKISMVWKGAPGFRVPILHGKLPCLCSRWLPPTPAVLITVKPAASFQGRAGLPAHPPPSCPGRDGVLTHHRGAGPFPGSGALQASAWLPPRAPHVPGCLLTALAVSFPGITPYSNRRSPLLGSGGNNGSRWRAALCWALGTSSLSLFLPSFLPSSLSYCVHSNVSDSVCFSFLFYVSFHWLWQASFYSLWLIQLFTKFIVFFFFFTI